MKNFVKILIGLGCLLTFGEASAQFESSVSSEINYLAEGSREFKSFVRVSPVIGLSNYELLTGDGSTGSEKSVTGGVLVGFGRGAFTVESGLLYFQGGGSVEYDFVDESGETGEFFTMDHHLAYIGIPLIAKYSYFERPQATFFTKAGVIPAFLIHAANGWTEVETETNVEIDYSDNSKDGLSEMDVLGVIGIGGTTPLGLDRIFLLDLSYFRGFLPIVPGSSYVNQGLALSVGLTFGL